MNKKLIAAVLTVLPTVSMADVTIYGTLTGGLTRDTVTDGASRTGIRDNTSLIGFKGEEELGTGLKAIWQIESRILLGGSQSTLDKNPPGLGNRQTFVGLNGGELGKVRIGILNSALKDLYKVDHWKYDNEFFNDKNNQYGNSGANGLVLLTNAGKRLKNAVRYDSSTFYGFNLNLEYGFGENKNNNNNTPQSSKTINTPSDIMSFGLNYSFAGLALHYAYQKERNPIGSYTVSGTTVSNVYQSGNTKSASLNFFEADYNFQNIFVGLAYQTATGYDWTDGFSGDGASFLNSPAGGGPLTPATQVFFPGFTSPAVAYMKTRQLALSAAYTWGAFKPKLSLAKGWDQKVNNATINDSGYKQYILGIDYILSKQTFAELSYGHLKFGPNSTAALNTRNTAYSTVGLSLVHSF